MEKLFWECWDFYGKTSQNVRLFFDNSDLKTIVIEKCHLRFDGQTIYYYVSPSKE